ncbi:hypothetical protein N8198_00780 [Gammaproteobacteria bacterium]|nr:hypothetical protein [Gammaproteobacteria bacterium]
MVEITTFRIWISASIAWPLFWLLVFDRWFALSPLGILIVFGIPIAAWVLWWKFYRGEDQIIALGEKFSVDKGVALLNNLKKHLINQ